MRLQPAKMHRLRLELGAAAATRLVAVATEDLPLCWVALCRAVERDDPALLLRATEELVSLAEPIGLGLLARVARDFGACFGSGDEVAEGAVFARLQRVCEDASRALNQLARGLR